MCNMIVHHTLADSELSIDVLLCSRVTRSCSRSVMSRAYTSTDIVQHPTLSVLFSDGIEYVKLMQ
jgi:hypothetical protein